MSTILGQPLFLVAVNPDGSNFTDYSALTLPSDIDPTGHGAFEAVEVVADGPILAFTLLGMVSPNPTTTAQAGEAVRAAASALTIAPDETAAMLLPPVSPFTPRVASGASRLWRWQIAGPVVFWGVDSFEPVTQALFDAVKAQAGGVPPAFWGRYIGEHGNLTPGEVDLLHSNNCKVLVIFADTGFRQLKSKAQAIELAKSAIKFASTPRTQRRGLGVPRGVWIYADTEYPDQSPTAEWFEWWFKTMQDPTISPYGGGVYGNTSTGAAAKFSKAFCEAYKNLSVAGKAGAYVYANQPEPGSTKACDPKYRKFSPDIPLPCNPPTVVYQYTIKCSVAVTKVKKVEVDYDLANAAGFASMW